MIRNLALSGLFIAGSVSGALAEGCAPKNGIAITKIEAMNQMMVNMDLQGFAAGILAEIGVDLTGSMGGVADIFANGFQNCATIAQRVDVGGMVQSVVVYNADVGPLFAYWMAVPASGDYRILSFTFDTELDAVLGKLH